MKWWLLLGLLVTSCAAEAPAPVACPVCPTCSVRMWPPSPPSLTPAEQRKLDEQLKSAQERLHDLTPP